MRSLSVVTILLWAMVAIALGGLTFGCEGLYEFVGLSTEQAIEQATADRQEAVAAITAARSEFWPLIHLAITGLATLAGGILTRYLVKEKKVNGALATAVRRSGTDKLKEDCEKLGESAGVGKKVKVLLDTA